jgi:hypothetical protein
MTQRQMTGRVEGKVALVTRGRARPGMQPPRTCELAGAAGRWS